MARHDTSSPSGLHARRAAVQLLRGVLEEKEQLSVLLGSGVLDRLEPADRARAQRLATTTLREVGRADVVISQFVEKMPPDVALNILRLAVVELCVEGEAPHGVVDSAVNLMKRSGRSPRMAGLANAVLRKVATEGPQMWPDIPPSRMPKWLRPRVVHLFDEATVETIEAAHLAGAPLDITLRDETKAEYWAEQLGAEVLPTGSLRINGSVQVTDLPGFEEGAWWIQDAAAAIAARMLNAQKGEVVLDMCAAPGGKTMQLAASGAEVTALDISPERMMWVEENLQRTGLTAKLIVEDALNAPDDVLYDAILLDAPCSATGTIRRHPDLPYVKDGKQLNELFALQADMIDTAVSLLKPGGRLVFCTCSLLFDEGERQAKTAMERHGLTEIETDLKGVEPEWRSRVGGLRLSPSYWPDRGGMDGFFMIALRKPE
ncbi:RsmB/NOP family class I SAM-dependent RNA methyltransferase [Litoreibacter arenae]|uniref:16S rRNA m(5)C 967 methyltransferase n=1 Tax=Litoreibacter arenae DSM 19593 TaxID=1123360 RepID=S9RV59_9RHOB|nr:transcription antitermination factor NusB [Litoreibacter arenae]EPX77854.1 16S rRNA m(5)C 967 methyltransferase [Litoreibacter arenae DSM 19593]